MTETELALYTNEPENFCRIARGETKEHIINAFRSLAISNEGT